MVFTILSFLGCALFHPAVNRLFSGPPFKEAHGAGCVGPVHLFVPDRDSLVALKRPAEAFGLVGAGHAGRRGAPQALGAHGKDRVQVSVAGGAYFFGICRFRHVGLPACVRWLSIVFFELPVHVRDVALVGEAEIPVVADDEVLVDRDAHGLAGEQELPGDGHVFGGGVRVPGRVVVGKDQCRGPVFQGLPDDLPGVHGAGGEGPLEQGLRGHDLVSGVQVDDLEPLAVLVFHVVVKVFKHLPGVLDRVFPEHLLLEEPVGHGRDQPDAQDVGRADAVDLAELRGRGLQNALKGLEALQGRLGGVFAVPPRGGQGQEQFDDLVVVKPGKP